MARISSKPLATFTDISSDDYLLGNDLNDGSIITKRFSLADLRTFVLEGTSLDILNEVPRGFDVTVNQAGNDVERSTLQITHQATLDAIELVNLTTLANADYAYGSNGEPTIIFENFGLPYHLPSFVGKTIQFVVTGPNSGTTYTATISSYDGFTLDGENVLDTFSISGIVPIQTQSSIETLTVTDGGARLLTTLSALAVSTDLTVGGDITNQGDVHLAGSAGSRVDIGTAADHDADVHIHGLVHFDEAGDGIVLGPIAPDTSTTTLTVDGMGNVDIIGIPSDDVPQWNFGSGMQVNVADTITTNGITNEGILNQNDDVTVAGDITITGVDVNGDPDGSSVTISSGSITTVGTDGISGPELIQITANNSTDFDTVRTEELSSIQIGAGNFTLPEFSAGVAEALPGFNETFGVNPLPVTSGRFFAGIEQSSGAIFVTELVTTTDSTTTPTIAAGDTVDIITVAGQSSVDLDDTTGDADSDPILPAQDAATAVRFENIRAQFQARGDSQERLFFVESGYTDAFPNIAGTTEERTLSDTDTNLYEVIAYDGVTRILTFGLLGEGTINIATSTLNISSEDVIFSGIPTEMYDGDVHDFVTVHRTADHAGGPLNHPINTLSRSSLNIAATANGARITEEGGDVLDTSIGITSLEFTGNHNVSRSTGDVTIDLSGRYNVIGGITQQDDISTNIPSRTTDELFAFDLVILRPTDSGDDQALTLPVGTLGDSIKIVNTSTINSDGSVGATTGQWAINVSPASGQKIMGIVESAMDSDLDLDDPTASFELVYSGSDLGWVIIGIN